MPLSNAEIEMFWVEAWNDVSDIIHNRDDYPCLLPNDSCVSVSECRAWLQQSVYDGFAVTVGRGWHEGRPALVVSRRPRELP